MAKILNSVRKQSKNHKKRRDGGPRSCKLKSQDDSLAGMSQRLNQVMQEDRQDLAGVDAIWRDIKSMINRGIHSKQVLDNLVQDISNKALIANPGSRHLVNRVSELLVVRIALLGNSEL